MDNDKIFDVGIFCGMLFIIVSLIILLKQSPTSSEVIKCLIELEAVTEHIENHKIVLTLVDERYRNLLSLYSGKGFFSVYISSDNIIY